MGMPGCGKGVSPGSTTTPQLGFGRRLRVVVTETIPELTCPVPAESLNGEEPDSAGRALAATGPLDLPAGLTA